MAIPEHPRISHKIRIFWCFAAFVPALLPAAPQGRPQKPALIRDTDVAEGKEAPPDVEKAKVYNPMMAEKIVKIGDFYYKRKNYEAAIERYLEALQYQPGRVDAYESLGRTYEKTGEIAKAVNIYKDFISKNPDSPKIPDFRSKLARLEKKS